MYTRRIFFTIAFILISYSVGASEVPKFKLNTQYSKVKPKLIKLGWHPIPPTSPGLIPDYLAKGYPEFSWCSGTGQNVCFVYWRRGNQVLQIATHGEADDPYFYTDRLCRRVPKEPRIQRSVDCP